MLKIGSLNLKNKNLSFVRKLLAPHTNRAYLVGGCVRDALLGKKIYDFDIEIYDILPSDFDRLMSQIGANGVGKSYFVYKIKFKNTDFDLSLPRTESKISLGHKGFEVAYCNDERTASKRRDFTINSMMINIFDGSLLDFWGGAKDLKKGVLRHIDDEKFAEDSLRVLRSVQFSSRLNFKIASKTLRLMKSLDISDLSGDRVAAELMKLFRAKFQGVGLVYLARLGLLKPLFGVSLSGKNLTNFSQKLQNATKIQKDEREFVYFLLRNFGVKTPNLKLPKSFDECLKQPFFGSFVSDEELLEISLKMPLKFWLGLNTKGLVARAKKLGVYDSKFSPNIDMNEILSLGLKGEKIGEELAKRQKIAIKNFLQSKI